MIHFVKMREAGKSAKSAWWFVTPEGEGTRLRIYASRFPNADAATAFIRKHSPDNPELEFKAVAAGRRS